METWWLSCLTAILFAAPCYSSASDETSASSASQSDALIAAPHPSDVYFALDHVVEVAIEMAPTDWDRLRGQTRTLFDILGGDCLGRPQADVFSWFRATVTVDGETYTDVGVRKKGFLGSLSEVKPSLKVRFDKYVDDQLLGGAMQRLTLNNAQQDGSMLNTCMAFQIFADAGLPAPRCNFATVALNGEDLGLYIHVESVKEAFVERNFADPNGNLYEGTLSDFRPEWRGTFAKKTNGDKADFSDIGAVVEALQDVSPAGLDKLKALVDIDSFLSFWGTEVLLGHWDGYAGNRNNYHIYRAPESPFIFIPWGVDQVFRPIDGPFDDFQSPPSVAAHGAIAHRLYREETTRQSYVLRLKELLDTVWNEAELLDRVDRMAAIVQMHALPERGLKAAGATKEVRSFINRRRAEILADLDPQPPAWPWPLSSGAICWPQIGAFDLVFETTWGSNESEEGLVVLTDYQLNGERQRFDRSWASAGIDTEDEGRDREDSPAAPMATISIFGFKADADLDILRATLPLAQLTSGARVVFDRGGVEGLHLELSPPYRNPKTFEIVARGGIEFAEASTEPGGKIAGRFYGAIFSLDNNAIPFADAYIIQHSDERVVDIGLLINEVAARGEPLDWFELYNATDAPIELGKFWLADDLADQSKRVPFPADVVIEPGRYLQILMDKDGWPGFALGRDEELGIWTMDGILVARVDWEDGQADEGASLARVPNITGDFQTVDQPTPGAPNRAQTAVLVQRGGGPEVFELHGNWPNPFNANVIIAFDVPQSASVHLVIYDVLGRRVQVLHSGEILAAGTYRTPWNGLDERGRPSASGVYLYRLTAGDDFSAVGRMALIR